MMNEYQAKELELLKLFIEICDKFGLTYYLSSGSVLGAVKYGGFIPWDDDIDVCLLRNEYEVFLNKAPKYLPNHIFLQNYRTDPNYPHITTKLRNSNTTWIEAGVSHIDMNHGIYLDIFPLDGYPKDIKQQKKFEHKKTQCERIRALSFKQNNRKIKNLLSVRTQLVYILNKFFGNYYNSVENIKKLEQLVIQYPPDSSDLWCNFGNKQGKLEYAPRSQYSDGTWAVFEGLKVRIPKNYDEYLTQKYGNWRADLPPEQQNSCHDVLIMDAHVPYKEYIR